MKVGKTDFHFVEPERVWFIRVFFKITHYLSFSGVGSYAKGHKG